MKKILSLFVALVAVLSLAACGKKESTAKGYGLVHKDYVGIAEITVDKKGVVTALTFEEVYFPTHWAGLAATEGVDAGLFVTYTTSKGKEANVAKYVVVDGKLFTGEVNGTDVKYVADGIADLKAACKDNEETAKWYAEALLAGKAFAANADGSKAAFEITADKEGGFKKSTTGYWPQGDKYLLGWKGNMEALSEALVGTSMGFADADLVKDAETKLWSFGGTVTKATLTDAKDYVAVAQKAYNTATK